MKEDFKKLRERLRAVKEGKESFKPFWEEAVDLLRNFLIERHGIKCTSPHLVYKALYHAGYLGREELDRLLSPRPEERLSVLEGLLERIETNL